MSQLQQTWPDGRPSFLPRGNAENRWYNSCGRKYCYHTIEDAQAARDRVNADPAVDHRVEVYQCVYTATHYHVGGALSPHISARSRHRRHFLFASVDELELGIRTAVHLYNENTRGKGGRRFAIGKRFQTAARKSAQGV